jgi:hypothetical protein
METHDLTTKMRPKYQKIVRNCESWANWGKPGMLMVSGPVQKGCSPGMTVERPAVQLCRAKRRWSMFGV